MSKPKISVVMSIFNQERFLREAVESILSQSFDNFECLISDDCSTDKSLKIIKDFKDKRIKVFQNEKRQGLAKSLNFLISKARGKYIARMDGDDISLSNRLKEQVEFLDKHPRVVLVGSWAKIINKQEKTIGEFKYPIKYKEIRKAILSYNSFIHPSVMFRKDILKKIGGYDESLVYSQDYDLFLRLVIKYRCINIPKFLLKFRWQTDFKKQRMQHWLALQIRLKAIKEYGYQRWEIIKLIKPLLFYLIPVFVKKIYWQKKFR